MATKIRALTKDDLGYYQVVGTYAFDDGYEAINSFVHELRVPDDDPSLMRSKRRQNTCAYFHLARPTFNYVLSGPNAQLLWKILGVSKAMHEKITAFTHCMDDAGELVPVDEAEENEHYLYGAEIAEKLIDDLDIDHEIIRCLTGACLSVFKNGAPADKCFTITQGSGDIHIAANFYMNLLPTATTYKKRTVSLSDTETVQSIIMNVLLGNGTSRFSYLYNMKRDKSPLYGMLNYRIVVVPSEMRPKMDNAEHKLTKRYVSVIKYNKALDIILNSMSPKAISAAYKNLDDATSMLQYKCADLPNSKPDDKSILERIKGKQGQVRKCNLGKRRDYSGRAVVTIDPFLSMDTIRIPKYMLPKLYEHHILPYLVKHLKANEYHMKHGTHVPNKYDSIRLSDLGSEKAQKIMYEILIDEKILDKVPCVLGRQPTLHRQSIQAFWVEPTDGMSIEMNPLVCPAFNMDFDGDQAWSGVPLSPMAVEEVRKLCLTTQNLFLAKDGSLTTTPRNEMVYGLYMCTRDDWNRVGRTISIPSVDDAREGVLCLKYKVYDMVNIPGYPIMSAGDAAVISCFPDGYLHARGQGGLEVCKITKKTVNKLLSNLTEIGPNGGYVYQLGERHASRNTIVGTLNRLVELGFKVSRLYPPDISILLKCFKETRNQAEIDKFHMDVEKIEAYYDLGLETQEHYTEQYEQRLSQLTKLYKDNMVASFGNDNGYKLMIDSGARGSVENMSMSFGIKGRVQKNDNEAFDAIIENSYSLQLTPIEQFVAAYGSRQGMKDKSLKTGDTGYLTRQSWHAEQGLHITCEDCGTSDGILVTKAFLRNFSIDDEPAKIEKDVQELFAYAITGRYLAGSKKMLTASDAQALAEDPSVKYVQLRSPITCKNPCCSMCYGTDWTTHKRVQVGVEVGIMSAQSLGESTTQSSLNNFHKGGIVNMDNVTSVFDKLTAYMEVKDIADMSKRGKYSGYDPLAWATGKVTVRNAKDSNYKVIGIEGSSKQITVPHKLVVKDNVTIGEGISVAHGDYDIHEMMAYCGIEQSQIYLAFKLYSLFESTCKIRMSHFESIVASMTRYMVVSTDRTDLMVGQFCTSSELYRGPVNNTKVLPRICGVDNLTGKSMDALDGIVMERQVDGLSRACALGLSDSMTKPINRMMMGLTVKTGTAIEGFMDKRYMT